MLLLRCFIGIRPSNSKPTKALASTYISFLLKASKNTIQYLIYNHLYILDYIIIHLIYQTNLQNKNTITLSAINRMFPRNVVKKRNNQKYLI